jgi:hypothetical protein
MSKISVKTTVIHHHQKPSDKVSGCQHMKQHERTTLESYAALCLTLKEYRGVTKVHIALCSNGVICS